MSVKYFKSLPAKERKQIIEIERKIQSYGSRDFIVSVHRKVGKVILDP